MCVFSTSFIGVAGPPLPPGARSALEHARRAALPMCFGVTKIDLVTEDQVKKVIAEARKLNPQAPFVTLATPKGDGLDALMKELNRIVPNLPAVRALPSHIHARAMVPCMPLPSGNSQYSSKPSRLLKPLSDRALERQRRWWSSRGVWRSGSGS